MTSVGDTLRATQLFKSLNDHEFANLCEDLETHHYKSNEVIVREGESGSELFVIAEGSVQVFTFANDGQEVVLAKIEAPGYFGEQALLPGTPDRRNAYVRAFEDCTAYIVPKQTFQDCLSKDSPLKEHLIKMGQTQIHEKLVKQSVLFRSLKISSEDSWHREESYQSGAIIFKQGELGDRFYVVISGTVGVYKEDQDGQTKLLVKLDAGQCFGELALIKKEPRAATIIAEGEVRVLSIDGSAFLDLYARVPELQDYMQTLQKVYVLPGRGFTTQHAGTFMGYDSIMTMYHLSNNRKVVASRVIGREIYNMTITHDHVEAPETLSYEKNNDHYQLEVLGKKIVGVTVQGVWEELGDVHRMILREQDIHPWQKIVFREKGTLTLEEEANFFEDSDLICHCMEINRGTLRRCIELGCKSQFELTERTGAGSVCGACIPRIKEMIGNTDWTPVHCVKTLKVNDETRTFRFATFDGTALKTFEPGQHVIVSAQIEGNWVQRPYTLSSPCQETRYHEITVKREPRGLFSNWLFDRMRDNAMIRLSSPQGEYKIDLTEQYPIVCFVGGIGVTPALSFMRSIIEAESKRRLHIDYSCSYSHQFAYIHEIQHASFVHDNFSCTQRSTRENGRLHFNDVRKYLKTMPEAEFYICGPEKFQAHVEDMLATAGVSKDRIQIEEFTPQGNKPANARVSGKSQALIQGNPFRAAPNPIPPGSRPGEGGPRVQGQFAEDNASVEDEAFAYLKAFYHEKGVPEAFEARWQEAKAEIAETGSYWQTYDEISYGAKLAWRNSARCIGRLFWQGLQVRDMRHLETEEQIFESICEHIRLATNNGNLRAVMTIFKPNKPGEPQPRLWNPQLIRYAGYQQDDGSVVGDPAQLGLTRAIVELGWEAPNPRTHFDILPIVIELPGREPQFFDLPKELVLEVEITHPDYDWFAELGLRWYALPAVSEMLFDCGGVQYSCAPFNGWYMGTEIGARNFSDEYRYNQLPVIAERMGLNTRRDRSLWKDRALVELNLAVLHSFELAGAKMTDHHAASNDFMEFIQQEAELGRKPDVRWRWVVPPISSSATEVFHVIWEEYGPLKPNYFYQEAPYKKHLKKLDV